jgi:parallel beta helix pectate lyase-like protein
MVLNLARLLPATSLGITMYVNSVSGNDSNSGLTSGAAKLTLDGARTALEALGGVGTIRVHAPITNPVQGFVTFSTGRMTLEGMDSGTLWYTERTTTWTSGWTDAGGGVWSRANGGGDADIMFVPTMLDSDGFGRTLLKNTSTPTTPAAGQFGRDATNFYVHLVGDASANSNTIKRHNTGFLIRASGTVRLTIRNGVGRYTGSNGVFECNAAGATMILENCTGTYSASAGVSLPVGAGTVICTNCTMQRHSNDGYNQHGGSLTLNNCDASYNDDEGAAVHDGLTLTIHGGRYHHNQSAGCSAVISGTKMYLTDVLVDFNGAKAGGGIETNGIVFDTGTSGSVTDCIAENNTGAGFYCNAATVEIVNLTSGLAAGNSAPDDEC